MSPSVLLFASLDLISRPRSARPYIVVMNAIPRTFFTARTRMTCPRCMQAQREPVVKDRDGGSDGAAGLLRRKAPLECLVDVVSKAETTTAARGHPPAASQATQPAKLNAISMASYDRTIFDFDPLLKTDVVITLRAHPNIP
ncbi:hypothetical protein EDB83DRAFT_2322665 [Lactarius deliciosus]|nr:hypothetical protein EDB83DRAFT_2322665 [Lactarius deliciosus]